MKRKVALIFGGRSVESDISVITAIQAYKQLDEREYDVEPIYLFDGDFYTGGMRTLADFTPFEAHKHEKVLLYTGGFYSIKRGKLKRAFTPDVALICCHGGEGENGTLQAMLEFYGVPHTSAGTLPSAICMDKGVSKEMFESMLLNVIPHFVITKNEYETKTEEILFHLESFLGYPMIVKPSRLGSSIGIRTAENREDLITALDIAKEFDDKIVVEQMLTDFVEVNCAVFKDKDGIVVSETERPFSVHDILTFEDKYVSGEKLGGGGRIMPADIGELNAVIKGNTKRLYEELDLDGVVRMDYLVDKTRNKVYINEINTIPGSLAYYLFEIEGITYSEMLRRIIDNAMRKPKPIRQTFSTGVLNNFHGGGKVPIGQ